MKTQGPGTFGPDIGVCEVNVERVKRYRTHRLYVEMTLEDPIYLLRQLKKKTGVNRKNMFGTNL